MDEERLLETESDLDDLEVLVALDLGMLVVEFIPRRTEF